MKRLIFSIKKHINKQKFKILKIKILIKFKNKAQYTTRKVTKNSNNKQHILEICSYDTWLLFIQ